MTKPTLVVGATGVLGRAIASLLSEAGVPVRALVRPARNNDVTRALAAANMTVCPGDLKEAASVQSACKGVHTVVSTATVTSSRLEGDSIETVDRAGQLGLIDSAEATGVSHFVYVSFARSEVDSALQRAKRDVEARLQRSRMTFTILQPTYFIEAWLSPAMGFDAVNGSVRMFGLGTRPVSWISTADVARFAVAGATNERMRNRTLALGGPDALSPQEVLRLFSELGAPAATVEHVSEDALESQRATAPDSLQEAYAALMLGIAKGQTIDPGAALELIPGRLSTVREFAMRSLNKTPITKGN